MVTTIVYWGYIGIMEQKMEATTLGLRIRVYGLGFRVQAFARSSKVYENYCP